MVPNLRCETISVRDRKIPKLASVVVPWRKQMAAGHRKYEFTQRLAHQKRLHEFTPTKRMRVSARDQSPGGVARKTSTAPDFFFSKRLAREATLLNLRRIASAAEQRRDRNPRQTRPGPSCPWPKARKAGLTRTNLPRVFTSKELRRAAPRKEGGAQAHKAIFHEMIRKTVNKAAYARPGRVTQGLR